MVLPLSDFHRQKRLPNLEALSIEMVCRTVRHANQVPSRIALTSSRRVAPRSINPEDLADSHAALHSSKRQPINRARVVDALRRVRRSLDVRDLLAEQNLADVGEIQHGRSVRGEVVVAEDLEGAEAGNGEGRVGDDGLGEREEGGDGGDLGYGGGG